jgi:hypothetical protein
MRKICIILTEKLTWGTVLKIFSLLITGLTGERHKTIFINGQLGSSIIKEPFLTNFDKCRKFYLRKNI